MLHACCVVSQYCCKQFADLPQDLALLQDIERRRGREGGGGRGRGRGGKGEAVNKGQEKQRETDRQRGCRGREMSLVVFSYEFITAVITRTSWSLISWFMVPTTDDF